MTKREEFLLTSLEEKTDEEKKAFLANKYNLNWNRTEGPCKIWLAKVFTYCTAHELEEELNFFLFIVNRFGYLWDICFNQEDTVFLGCTCPCGNKQTILYYSITFGD
ncbi:hypothetical protein [Anaerotignum sp.]|uniref:hypothetical protein n=1 Tax=Anaerotignum sp. TaxID=2039241 RepID=UPI0028B15867|nr:hypothetical protein [Anaerotignum sp.]